MLYSIMFSPMFKQNKGFADRLRKELRDITPPSVEINIVDEPNHHFAVWTGLLILFLFPFRLSSYSLSQIQQVNPINNQNVQMSPDFVSKLLVCFLNIVVKIDLFEGKLIHENYSWNALRKFKLMPSKLFTWCSFTVNFIVQSNIYISEYIL